MHMMSLCRLNHLFDRNKARHGMPLFASLLLMSLLSSCSHLKRHDGPPNFYVDETKIPNAVPKPEPLAKLGNMPSYRVFGKRYYTLKSSHNFEQVGTASWYGTMFHEHRTSSGEPYDMLAMTAAHKTLPLPTYVEVTNLKNKRKIIVKVNDRGPFESNRIIDLSYVAAKKLGMLGHGTAPVKIKAIDPYRYGNNIQLATHHQHHSRPDDGFYLDTESSNQKLYLQVGAYRARANAEKMQHHLSTLVSAPVHVSHPINGSSLYRVQVGPFNDHAAAAKIASKLKTMGIKSNKLYGA